MNQPQSSSAALQQCEYISNRTRIRCTARHPKGQLLKPHGFCGLHTGYIERIRREGRRARKVLDPTSFDADAKAKAAETAQCYSDSDDETLDVQRDWPCAHESLYDNSRINDEGNPLR